LDGSEEKTSVCQRQKKPCCAVKVDTATKEKTESSMFYLRNISMNPSDVFPKNMPEKICVNFTCKGKECTNASCDFTHPRRPSVLKRETILLIPSHFTKWDISWFDESHFMKMPNVTNEVKTFFFRNTKGPHSKTA
jgi:hypothetical protein